MNYKKEYKNLLETVKNSLSQAGKPHRNEDIAKDLGYNRSYFSQLLGEHGTVTAEHVRLLKLQYREMLDKSKADKGDHKTPPTHEITNEIILQAILKLTDSSQKIVQSNSEAVATTKVVVDTNQTLAQSNAKLVNMLEQKVITNSDVHELLDTVHQLQHTLQAAIFADALYKANGDEQRANEIVNEMNRISADMLRKQEQSDIGMHSNVHR
jgi:hypothetical protein